MPVRAPTIPNQSALAAIALLLSVSPEVSWSLCRPILCPVLVPRVVYYQLGQTLNQKTDLDGAIRALKNKLRLKPDFHGAYYSLGLSLEQEAAANPARIAAFNNALARDHYKRGSDLLSQGDLQGAKQELQGAVDADPDWAEAHTLLGFALGQGGELPAALDHLNRAVQLKPDLAVAHYHLGVALWYSGERARAMSELESAVQLDPASGKANAFLGMALREAGELDHARRYLQHAISLSPMQASPHVDLAVVFLKMGKFEAALAEFETTITISKPGRPAPDFSLAVAELRREISKRPDFAEAHNTLGRLLGMEGADAQEILSEFREAVRLRPNFAEARNNLGLVLAQTGRVEEAAAAFREAVRYQPEYADAHINLGAALIEDNVEEAIRELETAIELQPNLARAHFNLALAYGRKQGSDKEIEQLRKVIVLDPNFAEAYSALGKSLLAKGEVQDAIVQLRQAVKLDAKLGEAHYQLGLALARAGQSQDAAAEVQRGRELIALSQRAEEASRLMSQAKAEMDKGESDQALADLGKVIRLQPEYPEAHFNLGTVLSKQGDLEGAIAEFRRALELQPASYPSAYSLGQSLLKKGTLDDAIAMTRLAIRFRPSSAEAHNLLGLALTAKGERDGAVAAFNEARELDTEYVAAKENLEMVLKHDAPPETAAMKLSAPAAPAVSRAGLEELSKENREPLDLTKNFDTMIEGGKFKEVEPLLLTFLQEHPNSWRAHYQLGYLRLRQRKISDSIRELSKSLQLNLNFADAHRVLGMSLSIIGRYDAAQTELEQTVRLEPDSAEAHYELGRIYAAQDMWPKATKEFKEASRLNTSYAEAYNALGFAMDVLEDDAEAVANYQKAIQLSEQQGRNFAAPQINLSAHYNLRGNADLALQYAQAAIRLDAKSDLAYFQMAKAFRSREEWSQAAEALRNAIAINSNSMQYFYVLSAVDRKLGKLRESQEAIETFRKLEQEIAARESVRRQSRAPAFDAKIPGND